MMTETMFPDLAVLAALVRKRTSGRVRNLILEICPHGLVLAGRASSYYAKQLAQHAIMEATPIPISSNEIQVVQN